MVWRWGRWRRRDVVLCLAAAGVVALLAMTVGRQLVVCSLTTSDAAPLSLALSVPEGEFCETRAATGYQGLDLSIDERPLSSWGDVGEAPVQWTVTGGTPSYTLKIDGEQRDIHGKYHGARGIGFVSCAVAFEDSYFFEEPGRRAIRRFRRTPSVDVGVKTITATVRDGSCQTATATTRFHVVLEVPGSFSILKGGYTHRVFGVLITPPPGRSVEVGSTQDGSCEDDAPEDSRCGYSSFKLHIVDAPVAVALFIPDGAEASRWRYDDTGRFLHSSFDPDYETLYDDAFEDYLDRLVASANKLPNLSPTP